MTNKENKVMKITNPSIHKDEVVDCTKVQTDAERLACEEEARKVREATEIKTEPVNPE